MNKVTGFINLFKQLAKDRGPVTRAASPDDFAQAIGAASPQMKGPFQVGDFLTQYTPAEYAQMQTFLNKDKTAGYALKRILDEAGTPTGGKELVSVFNVGPGGRGAEMAAESVLRGARQLDNYSVQDVLPKLYGKAGFQETSRFPFDPQYAQGVSPALLKAAPDYVAMNVPQNVVDDLLRTRFLNTKEYLDYVQTGRIPLTKQKDVQNAIALLGMGGGAAATTGLLSQD